MHETPYKPNQPLPPLSTPLPGRSRGLSSDKIIVIVVLVLMTPFLIAPGRMLLNQGMIRIAMTIDGFRGPLQLESAVRSVSPDNLTRFEAEKNGDLRFVAVTGGQVLYSQHIPLKAYKRIDAKWLDNQRVNLTCSVRYPEIVQSREFIWNCLSGALQFRKAEGSEAEQEPQEQ